MAGYNATTHDPIDSRIGIALDGVDGRAREGSDASPSAGPLLAIAVTRELLAGHSRPATISIALSKLEQSMRGRRRYLRPN